METTAVRDLLALRLGLDPESLGDSFFEWVTRRGLRESGYTDLEPFVRDASEGGPAWRALIEHAVVSETWFFRDEAPFNYIVEAVRVRMRVASAPVRILSCPCSTGEEPYSVAMALIEAGIPPSAWAIDAADVSVSALDAATSGAFRARSFRSGAVPNRDQYFDHDPHARVWTLKPAYSGLVRFHPANLLSLDGLETASPYDVVLCRNLLIYLHADARARVAGALGRLLADTGVLVVGHAEPAIVREYGFRAEGPPAAFSFGKAGARVRPEAEVRRPGAADDYRADAGVRRVSKVVRQPVSPTLSTTVSDVSRPGGRPVPGADALDAIRRTGDKGDLQEAVLACSEYLRRVPDSADGHFLLGVLQGAMGHRDAAETALRRAVYLAPDHAEALVHLALMHDARGDAAGAARLRARGARVQPTREGDA